MRLALALIVMGLLAFAVLSRDWVADLTGLSFLGVRSTAATNLEGVAQSSRPSFEGITRLQTKVFGGHVRVSVGAEPKLTLTKRGRVEVKTERQGDTFVITGRALVRPCWRCEVSVDLTVPAGLQLSLETSNGPVEVRGAVRGLSANTSNGAITTQGTGTANLKLETSNGRIEVEDAEGAVEANTSNGRVRLRRVRGSLRTETSNSGVILDRVTLGAGTLNSASTSNGSIEVTGLSVAGGLRVEGSTSNGGLNLQMPGFSVQQDKTDFTATKEGAVMASLRLETSNSSITVRP